MSASCPSLKQNHTRPLLRFSSMIQLNCWNQTAGNLFLLPYIWSYQAINNSATIQLTIIDQLGPRKILSSEKDLSETITFSTSLFHVKETDLSQTITLVTMFFSMFNINFRLKTFLDTGQTFVTLLYNDCMYITKVKSIHTHTRTPPQQIKTAVIPWVIYRSMEGIPHLCLIIVIILILVIIIAIVVFFLLILFILIIISAEVFLWIKIILNRWRALEWISSTLRSTRKTLQTWQQ